MLHQLPGVHSSFALREHHADLRAHVACSLLRGTPGCVSPADHTLAVSLQPSPLAAVACQWRETHPLLPHHSPALNPAWIPSIGSKRPKWRPLGPLEKALPPSPWLPSQLPPPYTVCGRSLLLPRSSLLAAKPRTAGLSLPRPHTGPAARPLIWRGGRHIQIPAAAAAALMRSWRKAFGHHGHRVLQGRLCVAGVAQAPESSAQVHAIQAPAILAAPWIRCHGAPAGGLSRHRCRAPCAGWQPSRAPPPSPPPPAAAARCRPPCRAPRAPRRRRACRRRRLRSAAAARVLHVHAVRLCRFQPFPPLGQLLPAAAPLLGVLPAWQALVERHLEPPCWHAAQPARGPTRGGAYWRCMGEHPGRTTCVCVRPVLSCTACRAPLWRCAAPSVARRQTPRPACTPHAGVRGAQRRLPCSAVACSPVPFPAPPPTLPTPAPAPVVHEACRGERMQVQGC